MSHARAADPAPPLRAGRLSAAFEEIEFEYSPGQEELARSLAKRLAVHNQAVMDALEARKSPVAAVVPLSPEDLRANRQVYLGKICALLALAQPTSLQEECYDAFLNNYEETMRLFALMRSAVESWQVIRRCTIWERAELVKRLETNEKIKGFTYDPATKLGGFTFGMNAPISDESLKLMSAKREKLRRTYRLNFETKDGVTTYRAGISPRGPADVKDNTTAPKADSPVTPISSEEHTDWFAVIVPDNLVAAPAEEQSQKLWEENEDRSLLKTLQKIQGMAAAIPRVDPQIAFLLLHETTEIGVGEQYFRGPDRRWFCDGIANYVPWRIVRDLHGEATALTVYDLKDQLSRQAPWREQADLRRWPTVEHQSEADQHTALNTARYAFAANAIFIMNDREGESILPRLLREIGKTKPDKVSMRTVEKAWKKVTDTSLTPILEDAVLP